MQIIQIQILRETTTNTETIEENETQYEHNIY